MTGEAARILRMEHRIVRFAMAVGALWNVAMLALVAGNAGYSLMFTGSLRQCGHYRTVTDAASV